MNKLSRILVLLLVGLLVLTGCSSKKGADEGDYALDSELELTWLNILHTPSPPNETVKNEIEAYTNSKIDFTWVPDASKEERLTTALSSGVLADVVTLTNVLQNSSVRNALKGGVFWDVEEYLAEFPNLAAIAPERIASAKVDGKLYGVPFQKALARSGFVIRKDWLDNVGLDVPTTLDELMEVARAFTEDDPDGNGVNDTVAFGDRSDLRYSSFKLLSAMHGAPNGWKEENGVFTPEFDTQEYKDTLVYSNTLFKNGYLFQDFAVTAKTEQQQQFAQGKTGIYTGMIDILNLRNLSQGLQEGLELVPVNKIGKTAGDTDYHIWSEGNGVGGLLAFPKAYVKSEAHLKRILKFINDLMDEEMYVLMTSGIEGTHFEYDADGVAQRIDDDLWKAEVQPFSSSRPSEVTYQLKASHPEKALADELVIENDKFAVLNPALLLDSKTFNEKGTELEKIVVDASIQFIMGEIDMKGFEDAVEKWYNQGGSDIKAEYEEDFKAAQ